MFLCLVFVLFGALVFSTLGSLLPETKAIFRVIYSTIYVGEKTIVQEKKGEQKKIALKNWVKCLKIASYGL